MKFKRPASPLTKKARKGFRGYPIATVAFYGPDDRRATKVAGGAARKVGQYAAQKVIHSEGGSFYVLLI